MPIKPMILGFKVSTYAMVIYLYGTNRLTARGGFTGITNGYYIPVEQYAANTNNNQNVISKSQIDQALASGYINQQEYDETISYIPV